MTTLLILAVSVLFLLCIDRLGLIDLGYRIVNDSRSAIQVMSDGELDDEAKEKAIRQMAGGMLVSFIRMVGLFTLAAAGPAVVIVAAVSGGLTDVDAIVRISTSTAFLVANAVLFAAAIFWRYRA